MTSLKIDLSIIIVNYNTSGLITSCLSSFYNDVPENYEIIIVDNASGDNSVEVIKKNYPKVKLLINKSNKGYASANNKGIRVAKGRYLCLLSSDTITSIRAFKTIVQFLDKNSRVGIASPKLVNSDTTVQQNGGALPNLINIFSWQFFIDELPLLTHLFRPYQDENTDFYKLTQKTGWVSGAAMFIRKDCLEQVGLLDEKIFMYGEDVDLCIRANKKSWQVWSVSEAEVVHLGQGSGNSSSAILGEYKGLKYVLGKHTNKTAFLYNLMMFFGALFRATLFKLLGNRKKHEIYIQAANLVR